MVGPFIRNCKSTHRSSLKEEGIDSGDSTGFKDRKTLTAQGVKWVGNLGVSQKGAATMCI
ncbi:conserved hypothetical protein [delta proteobacterium NaphS2]|nr:conserved hypothetical protein [delta proteobacterium NaphS2]